MEAPSKKRGGAGKIMWQKAKVTARAGKEDNMPSARSGHTLTVVGSNAFLFGGLDGRRVEAAPLESGEKSAKARKAIVPNNELFMLRIGSREMEWTQLKLPDEELQPLPRWRHSATLVDGTQVVIFGGMHSSNHRLNDVWVFNTVTMDWWQPAPNPLGCGFTPRGSHPAPPATSASQIPSPRGGHSAVLIDAHLWLFGGYGGYGYGRRELDELHKLDVATWRWAKVSAKGRAPERRSGHRAVNVESLMYVLGGSNAVRQFDDLHILDCSAEPPLWSTVGKSLDEPRWNHAACSVMAIPSWKVFVFGGAAGELHEHNRQGIHLNDVAVLDSGSNRWTHPTIAGDAPVPRCDVALEYDAKGSKLILFGGWAERWLGDVYTLDVGSVVGPPYAVMDIHPPLGAITGGTAVSLTGIDFVPTEDVIVRFAAKKGGPAAILDVRGKFVSSTHIECLSPDFSAFPAGDVEVRVALDGDSFTTTFQKFTFFAVTDAQRCLMYGPGLLSGCAVNEETMFIVQARDKTNANRTTGGDLFEVKIRLLEGGEDGDDLYLRSGVHMQDMDDGTYVVTYTAPNPGKYVVEVDFNGTFGGTPGPVRGSGQAAVFEEFVPRSNNAMSGKVVMGALKQDIKFLLDLTRKTAEGVTSRLKDDSWTPEQATNALVAVKEALNLVEAKRDEVALLIDRSAAIIGYLKAQSVNLGPLEVQLNMAKTQWIDVLKEVPAVQSKIAPLIKSQSARTKGDIARYGEVVGAYVAEVNGAAFKNFSTGQAAAIELLAAFRETHASEQKRCEEMAHLATMFECPDDMKEVEEMIEAVEGMLKEYEDLWACGREVNMYIEEACEMLWVDLNADGLEENARLLTTKTKKLPKGVKTSDAYKGLDRYIKEFLSTCPLVASLRSKAMRDRHWEELMDVTKQEFTLPDKDPSFRLRDILDLNLHKLAPQVEELTEKATREAKHEETLANLAKTWSGVQFQMSPYKKTDVPLLRMSDDDTELLEADQLVLQGQVASRYTHFRKESVEWKTALANISDVNQVFGEIQRTWSYLEPLFVGSDEVKKELPEDAKKFAQIDFQVRATLRASWGIKNVKEAANQEGLVEKLEQLQGDQDQCKKSLTDFLDGKRRLFPRFFFVSEADLLDILSNGSSPEKIMVHVNKVLLATKSLELQSTPGQRPKAVEFVASVGVERVAFEALVKLEGKCEVYLATMLAAQQAALAKNLDRSIKRYRGQSRTEWLLNKVQGRPTDPAQISLLVAGIMGVKDMEAAMDKVAGGDVHAIDTLGMRQKTQLADLIKLTQTSLDKGDRQRVMCMITLDAHTRDIVEKLVREDALAKSDFQWQSQLKQRYVEPKGGETSAELEICDAKFGYGFEYLGNGSRLVVTPLTDRIYVTATQALNLMMGCAPAGPAGTGKTETTKDLASNLAKCCYVVNCSPEMDYRSLGDIFKGVASSGSWICFDEFNRLVPEVLSVCTVQFKSVCDGKRVYSIADARTQVVTIEGDQVKLDPTCGAFITMNPGYLGRSELPEGLKALFRPMTVMVPDLVLICENMLMAEGYLDAKVLASKFYGLYSLLKDLLSKQEHYDWGLRAVKSVLVVAGKLKRSEPTMPEDALLMRALRDFNRSKIVAADEVVFFGLLADLFPGLEPKQVVDEALALCAKRACESVGLWADENFILKVTQLDELLHIRHCVFVMGPPAAGKSQCWRTLAAARALRSPGDKVMIRDVNPKTVPTEDLYGHISLATREWKDGLLSTIMRDLGQIPDTKAKWIMLDGDLDANWIESMNSVMDDNRMLTLASNERIPLKDHMRMVFEIRDLKYATPATVSRAGIIYLSMDAGYQWSSLIASWVQARPNELYTDETKDALQGLFSKYVPETLKFYIKTLQGVVGMSEVTLVQTLLRLLDAVLDRDNIANTFKLEVAFVFCAVWAFGSCLSLSDDGTDHRKLFSEWWRGAYKTVRIPARDTVFDYWLDPTTSKFEAWKQAPAFKTVEFDSRSMSMSDVTVPTTETASITSWMESLVKAGVPVMLAGPAGTGKTQLISGVLREQPADRFLSSTINLNFYSTAGALLSAMELPLQKRTGSTYGPPGAAKLIYFIDDLNLPALDKYNTQSAIALVRQHRDYGHWYDTQKLTLKTISDVQYVAAMNPAAGSFSINPRLQRHFTTFAVGMPSATSLLTIYQTFLDGHLGSNSFPGPVCGCSSNLIKGALALHKEVAEAFRKTAKNFHYEYNAKHLSGVFQGLLLSKPQKFESAEKLVFLWVHESCRVYGDRLVTGNDLVKFYNIMQGAAKKAFPQYNTSRFFINGKPSPDQCLAFCHYVDGVNDEPEYDMTPSINQLRHTVEGALNEYNEFHAKMDLVLFNDALLHVTRITRVVQQRAGHMLLVGVGGSGKQSLTRLSSHLCGYTTVQIVITGTYGIADFKSDLQNMYMKAGVKGEGVMFLFCDSQIKSEKFLVYVNDLLSSGRIPDLFTKDEMDGICNTLAPKVKAAGMRNDAATCAEYFISQVRQNLHVVLAFSPVGDDMRARATKFPALVSCTTIDWYQPWPRDALESVGRKFLAEMEFPSSLVKEGVEKFMPMSFEAVNARCEMFDAEQGRKVYTTPKSYLELLSLYKTMLETKRQENDTAVTRLSTGIVRLNDAAEATQTLEAKLKDMLIGAEEKRELSEAIAAKLSIEKDVVGKETEKAQVEQEAVAKLKDTISAQQADAEKDLSAAEPLIAAAIASLDTLDKKDLGECKSMTTPPKGVDDVFAAVVVLMARVHDKVVVGKNGKVKDKDRQWDAAKKALLSNVNLFIDELKGFKQKIDEGAVPKVNFSETKQYLKMEHFTEEVIAKKNSAAAGLCVWVINICLYYEVWSQVEPKRAKLKASSEQLEAANVKLAAATAQLNELQAQLAKLEAEFQAAEDAKLDAIKTAETGKLKLDLAQRLTNALGSEGTRWAANIEELKASRTILVGDVLLASAFISYIGPFSKPYRDALINETFVPFLRTAAAGQSIPMAQDIDVLNILTDEARIADWNTYGLPADPVSSENGAVVMNTVRWPLLIDPQLQGVAWLKSMLSGEEGRKLQLTRLGTDSTLSTMAQAIENGSSVVIENMGERIDAVLMPIVQRAIITRSGRKYMQIGDSEIELNPQFRLFMHTKMQNPHYPPEIQAEVTLVNFSLTPMGLEDQLLALVVRKERPDLASKKAAIIHQSNLQKVAIKALEDDILIGLSSAEGDVTENRDLIESLEGAKRSTLEAQQKLAEGKEITASINTTSEKFRPVANRGALLFFLMNELHRVHTYYMYSLNAFVVIFEHGIDVVHGQDSKPKKGKSALARLKAAASKTIKMARFNWNSDRLHANSRADESDLLSIVQGLKMKKETDAKDAMSAEDFAKRCDKLSTSITSVVYNYVRRGLFESDKLTVVTLLAFRILAQDGRIDPVLHKCLLKARLAEDPPNMPEDVSSFISEAAWARLRAVEEDASEIVEAFQDLNEKVAMDVDEWQTWYNHPEPESMEMPGDLSAVVGFEKLLVVRALRPDRMPAALLEFVKEQLGQAFVQQPPFDMTAAYQESSASTPIFFVLFPGVDPTPWIEKLGKTFDISQERGTLVNISMGQGQEKPAEAKLQRMAETGGWICLQNLHLMQSWLPVLDRALEVLSESANPNFRCFISAEPPSLSYMRNMPEALLQSCIKVANENPSDLKSNLRRAWSQFSQERLDGVATSRGPEFKATLFGLCFFHSLMLGRKKFGSMGWSRKYGFNSGDLSICADVLERYLTNAGDGMPVPWQDLRYIFGEIMYGGHITDFWDRRTNNTYLEVVFNEGLLDCKELAPRFASPRPQEMSYDAYATYIDRSLPAESPVLFGMHPNAEIGYLTGTTERVFSTILRLESGSAASTSSGGKGARDVLEDLALKQPKLFDLRALQEKAKPLLTTVDSPYVVVATQECTRMVALLTEMSRTVDELRKGLNGQLNMSPAMEDLVEAFTLNEVPGRNPFSRCTWEAKAWPSRKPLNAWFFDLVARCECLRLWESHLKLPYSTWISGLFNPTSFLTAVTQVVSRADGSALDAMTVETHVTRMLEAGDALEAAAYPAGGAYVHGLFIEGARWMSAEESEDAGLVDSVTGVGCMGALAEARLKELSPAMPLVYIKAVPVTKNMVPTAVGVLRNDKDIYNCPVYTTSFRGPTFVFTATLRTQQAASVWTLAAVCLTMQSEGAD